jgi:Fur family peroxide stress response transcriptional regulator
MEIFRALAASMEHPDAETVYQAVGRRMPSISRDTVYRTLATLEGEGLIRKVSPLVEKARYDAHTERHHHFICTVCGLVRDFYSADLDDLPIPPAVKAFGEIESAQVEVRGICSVCAQRQGKTRQRRSE